MSSLPLQTVIIVSLISSSLFSLIPTLSLLL